MAFEELRVRIAMLMDEIAGKPDDPHVLQERLRETLEEMKAMGLPLPADLVDLERALEEGMETGPRVRPGSDEGRARGRGASGPMGDPAGAREE